MVTKREFRRGKLAASAVCSVLALAGVAPASAQVQPQTTQIVSLLPGESTTITLRENASTGYRWQLNPARSTNLAIVHVVDRGYQAGQSGLIGAAGSHGWEIEAVSAGSASIMFTFARPWEHEPPAETYVVQVTVAPRP